MPKEHFKVEVSIYGTIFKIWVSAPPILFKIALKMQLLGQLFFWHLRPR